MPATPDDTRCHGRRWLHPPAGAAPAYRRSWLHTGLRWPRWRHAAQAARLQQPGRHDRRGAGRRARCAAGPRAQLELLELLCACRLTLEALAALVRDPHPHLRSPLVDRVTTALQAADALQDRLGREIEQLQQVTP